MDITDEITGELDIFPNNPVKNFGKEFRVDPVQEFDRFSKLAAICAKEG